MGISPSTLLVRTNSSSDFSAVTIETATGMEMATADSTALTKKFVSSDARGAAMLLRALRRGRAATLPALTAGLRAALLDAALRASVVCIVEERGRETREKREEELCFFKDKIFEGFFPFFFVENFISLSLSLFSLSPNSHSLSLAAVLRREAHLNKRNKKGSVQYKKRGARDCSFSLVVLSLSLSPFSFSLSTQKFKSFSFPLLQTATASALTASIDPSAASVLLASAP